MRRRVLRRVLRRGSKKGLSRRHLEDRSTPFREYDPVGVCPIWDFPDFSGIFPICSGMVRGFSRFVPFLFLGLLYYSPTRNSPERVRDTIWTFPEKSGKPPGLASLNLSAFYDRGGAVGQRLQVLG